MFALPILTCLIRFSVLLIYYTKETPKFYLINNEEQMAYEVLQEIYHEDYILTNMERLQKDVQGDSGEQITYEDLFTTLRYPVIIGVAIVFFQQFTGINSVTFYSNVIFEKGASSKNVKGSHS